MYYIKEFGFDFLFWLRDKGKMVGFYYLVNLVSWFEYLEIILDGEIKVEMNEVFVVLFLRRE